MNRERIAKCAGLAAGAVAVSVFGLGIGTGCAGYGNYPNDGGYRALDSPNSPHMSEVIRKAVVAAVDRAHIDGRYAVRLPESMDATRRQRILDEIDDAYAVVVTGDETTDLPEFVVERAIVRVNHAEVDIAIPVEGMRWPDGSKAEQLTTYYLKSGFGGWSVERMRTWSVGVNERAIVDIENAKEELNDTAVAEEAETQSSDEPPF